MAVKGKQFKMQILKSEPIFTEHTAFISQPLVFILVIYGCIAILVPIIALIKDGALPLLPLFVLLFMPLILLIILISICRISVLITDESIYLKLYPVQFKYRKIPLNSIERILLVEDVFKFHFNFLLKELGFKIFLYPHIYMYYANQGKAVFIVTKSKKLLIGSKHSTDLYEKLTKASKKN